MNISITLVIVIITVAISLYASENSDVKRKLLMNPYLVHHRKKYYRIISHAFIHADLMHLGLNMYILYIFGTTLENEFNRLFGEIGAFYYIFLYLGGIIFATIISMLKHKDNPGYNSLGASGAVSAVLFSFILFFPMKNFYGFIPAFIFGFIYIGYEMYQNKNKRSNIAHDAHIMGAIFGLVYTFILNPSFFLEKFNF